MPFSQQTSFDFHDYALFCKMTKNRFHKCFCYCNVCNTHNVIFLQTLSTGDIVITKVFFPEGQAPGSQVRFEVKLRKLWGFQKLSKFAFFRNDFHGMCKIKILLICCRRRRHKTPRKRKSRVKTFLHCDLVLSWNSVAPRRIAWREDLVKLLVEEAEK